MATCEVRQTPKVHPLADIFPPMSDAEYKALKKDIADNGQMENVSFWNGMLVDGRHRWRACLELGIECLAEDLECNEEELLGIVLSRNLYRRHLNESQRAMVAGKLAKLKVGKVGNGRKVEVSIDTPTLEQAADMLNVGRASVARAKQVLDAGSPEIIAAVETGKLPVSFAAKFVTEEDHKPTQSKLWKEGGKDALKKHITEPSPYVEDDTAEPCVESDDDRAEKLALKAIALLERIRNRPQRSKAIERVMAWIEQEVSKPIADPPASASSKSKPASSKSPEALSKKDKVKEREAKVRAFKRKAIDWMTDHQPCLKRDFCRWATENLPPIPSGQTKDTYPECVLLTIGTLNAKDDTYRLRAKYQKAVTA